MRATVRGLFTDAANVGLEVSTTIDAVATVADTVAAIAVRNALRM
jgi:hypothetical protein